MKKQNGITLIALVITIIVLLILAGVSIAMLTGENGILNKATTSVSATKIAEAKEAAQLDVNTKMADYYDAKYTNGTTTYADFAAYLAANKLVSSDTNLYTVDATNGKTITLVPKGKDATGAEVTITGTIGDNGGITWSDATTTPSGD